MKCTYLCISGDGVEQALCEAHFFEDLKALPLFTKVVGQQHMLPFKEQSEK